LNIELNCGEWDILDLEISHSPQFFVYTFGGILITYIFITSLVPVAIKDLLEQ